MMSELGWSQDGIAAATEMSWFVQDDHLAKSNLIEMSTGEDRNGTAADAGFTVYLGADGTLRNYWQPDLARSRSGHAFAAWHSRRIA